MPVGDRHVDLMDQSDLLMTDTGPGRPTSTRTKPADARALHSAVENLVPTRTGRSAPGPNSVRRDWRRLLGQPRRTAAWPLRRPS
jgi:hypothetical protein